MDQETGKQAFMDKSLPAMQLAASCLCVLLGWQQGRSMLSSAHCKRAS